MFAVLRLLLVLILLSLPAALIGLPWTFLRGDISFLYRWAMWIVRTGFKAVPIRVLVSGLEHIPSNRVCIFMANHVSNLDPAALFPFLPFRTAFIVKQQLFRIPCLGIAMKWGDFVPVARDGRMESARASVEHAGRVLASGVHIFTFPEGTRSATGRLQRFRKGPFYLALTSGAPVVPVSIWGTNQMMPKGSWRLRPGVAHIMFHPAVQSTDQQTRDDLMIRVQSAIVSGLPESMHPGAGERKAT